MDSVKKFEMISKMRAQTPSNSFTKADSMSRTSASRMGATGPVNITNKSVAQPAVADPLAELGCRAFTDCDAVAKLREARGKLEALQKDLAKRRREGRKGGRGGSRKHGGQRSALKTVSRAGRTETDFDDATTVMTRTEADNAVQEFAEILVDYT